MPPSLTFDALKQYDIFKYSVYLLLTINIFVFFREELLAAQFTYAGGIALPEIIGGFAATIDTAAWVILLLLFELETSVIAPEKLTSRIKWILYGMRALCYGFIVYAFYGYLEKCQWLYDVVPIGVDNLCAWVDGVNAFIMDLDEYVILDDKNCLTLPVTEEMFQMTGLPIYADTGTLWAARRLAWADVINSGAWISVVLLLEADMGLQRRGLLKGLALLAVKGLKALLYSILLIVAVYWGLKGDFIDFWDAFWWIAAFIFIEVNMFGWAAATD